MSEQYTLSRTDLMKIGKGALIAIGGAALTYIAGIAANIDYTVHFQDTALNLTPFVTAALSILVNAGFKFIQGQEIKPDERNEVAITTSKSKSKKKTTA